MQKTKLIFILIFSLLLSVFSIRGFAQSSVDEENYYKAEQLYKMGRYSEAMKYYENAKCLDDEVKRENSWNRRCNMMIEKCKKRAPGESSSEGKEIHFVAVRGAEIGNMDVAGQEIDAFGTDMFESDFRHLMVKVAYKGSNTGSEVMQIKVFHVDDMSACDTCLPFQGDYASTVQVTGGSNNQFVIDRWEIEDVLPYVAGTYRLQLLYNSGLSCYQTTFDIKPDEAKTMYERLPDEDKVKEKAVNRNKLGNKYYKEDNYAEAVIWYRKSAELGYDWGQYNLGYMYQNGYGIERDETEAAKWYRKAADQGNASAEKKLMELKQP